MMLMMLKQLLIPSLLTCWGWGNRMPEFVTHWEPQLLSYPTTLQDVENPAHHAKLTDAGTLKLQEAVRNKCDADLFPGEDYVVKDKADREDDDDDTWLAFPAGPDTEHFRYT